MSLLTTVSDRENELLSRREIVCDFAGLGGKLKKLEAIEMVRKQYELKDKTILPIRLRTHTGRVNVTGTFYVYEDDDTAKQHVDPKIFSRLERAKNPETEDA